jgi:hypothetical protein
MDTKPDLRSPKRVLEIPKPTKPQSFGLCLLCNRKFESWATNPETAKLEIQTLFDRHVCNELRPRAS